jgi:hypothetical protein
VFTHAPRRPLDVQDHGVVHEAVQDGGRDHRITKDLPPLGASPGLHERVQVRMPLRDAKLIQIWEGAEELHWGRIGGTA